MRKPTMTKQTVHHVLYCGRAAEYPPLHSIPCIKGMRLVCPGCSDQDIFLGRCHASILASKFDAVPVGMQGLDERRLRQLMFAPDVLFVGRRPPRGMKKCWPNGKCERSVLSNPFVVKKGGFTLGESLALYNVYVNNGFKILSEDLVSSTVAAAPRMPSDQEILRLVETDSERV